MQTGFQRTVNRDPAPGLPGSFASANPHHSMPAGPAGLVSGPNGLLVGNFAWVSGLTDVGGGIAENANATVPYAAGMPIGLVHRESNIARISIPSFSLTVLNETSLLYPAGYETTLMIGGDFWAGYATNVVAVGHKVFMSTTDGSLKTAAAGATVAGFVETGWYAWTPAAVGGVFKISKSVTGS